VPVHTGDELTLGATDPDASMIKNRGQDDRPIVILGIDAEDDPFNGQYVQFEVDGVSRDGSMTSR